MTEDRTIYGENGKAVMATAIEFAGQLTPKIFESADEFRYRQVEKPTVVIVPIEYKNILGDSAVIAGFEVVYAEVDEVMLGCK